MKKILFVLTLIGLLAIQSTYGQIISQYTKTNTGTKPKGIEIWNNTSATLDFSSNNLKIEQGTNGASPVLLHTISSGTLGVGEVLIIGTSDMEAIALTNGVIFSLRNFTYNGDDALVVKYGDTTTDIFGEPGSDPGTAWTGNGVSTNNQNIQLKNGISTGTTTGWSDPSIRFEYVGPGNDLTGFGIAPSTTPIPTIDVSATALSGFTYEVGNGPSAHQTFTVSGENLTNHITITPPSQYEISLDGSDYFLTYGFITLVIDEGAVPATTIYVRLKEGLTVGAYNQDISISSIFGPSHTLNCNSMVTAPPNLLIPFTENFTASLGSFTPYSETGAQTWVWETNSEETYAYINGFSGSSNTNIDWLVSSTFDFTGLDDLELTFTEAINSLTNYSDLQLFASTNYNGNVATSTWDELSITNRPSGNSWVFSTVGAIDLSAYNNVPEVTFAYKYTSNTSTSSEWGISQFTISQGGTIPPPGFPNAWINELHYDNVGPDTNEMVEVVIENASTYVLSDFKISLYNGGNGATYNTKTLDQFTAGNVIGNYSIFYFIYPNNSIQNGAPDGLSLDYKDDVIQFLSYEGTFAATNGPAIGLTSMDIVAKETGTTPVGNSLQLVGIGLEYSHFNWIDPPASPGSINNHQFFGTPPPPVPVDWRYIIVLFALIALVVVYRKIR